MNSSFEEVSYILNIHTELKRSNVVCQNVQTALESIKPFLNRYVCFGCFKFLAKCFLKYSCFAFVL